MTETSYCIEVPSAARRVFFWLAAAGAAATLFLAVPAAIAGGERASTARACDSAPADAAFMICREADDAHSLMVGLVILASAAFVTTVIMLALWLTRPRTREILVAAVPPPPNGRTSAGTSEKTTISVSSHPTEPPPGAGRTGSPIA